jgi:hypothetical protein
VPSPCGCRAQAGRGQARAASAAEATCTAIQHFRQGQDDAGIIAAKAASTTSTASASWTTGRATSCATGPTAPFAAQFSSATGLSTAPFAARANCASCPVHIDQQPDVKAVAAAADCGGQGTSTSSAIGSCTGFAAFVFVRLLWEQFE